MSACSVALTGPTWPAAPCIPPPTALVAVRGAQQRGRSWASRLNSQSGARAIPYLTTSRSHESATGDGRQLCRSARRSSARVGARAWGGGRDTQRRQAHHSGDAADDGHDQQATVEQIAERHEGGEADHAGGAVKRDGDGGEQRLRVVEDSSANNVVNHPPVSRVDWAKNWSGYPLTDPEVGHDEPTGHGEDEHEPGRDGRITIRSDLPRWAGASPSWEARRSVSVVMGAPTLST